MRVWGSLRWLVAGAVVCVALVTLQAQRGGGAGGGQSASQAPASPSGQRGGGGGRGDAPMLGAGTLISGAWGADATPVDSRGWGWATKGT